MMDSQTLGVMNHLPHTATDEVLIQFVDGWARLMEAEDYDAAFAYTAHSPYMHWSPKTLREAVKSYDNCLPTQRVTLEGRATGDLQAMLLEQQSAFSAFAKANP